MCVILTCCCTAGVWEYIEVTRDQVRDLDRRVRLAKGNVEAISDLMAQWGRHPLYQRKEEKKDCLLALEVWQLTLPIVLE